MGIEEGAGADEVAEAEEAAGDGVPKRDGIIANQIGEGLLAPFLVGVEDEFFVSGGGWDGGAVLFEFAAEIVAAVEADVADEPEAAIEGARLLRGLRGGPVRRKVKTKPAPGCVVTWVASGPRKASAAAMRSRRARSGGSCRGR